MATSAPSLTRPSDARERLLRTASELFYREGIHSVGVDRIVAIGGDGTVREVAGALSRTGALADAVALGVVPTGTANLWSNSNAVATIRYTLVLAPV